WIPCEIPLSLVASLSSSLRAAAPVVVTGQLLAGSRLVAAFSRKDAAVYEALGTFEDLAKDLDTDVPGTTAAVELTARFTDSAGNIVAATVAVSLSCGSGNLLCGGTCTSALGETSCGGCNRTCESYTAAEGYSSELKCIANPSNSQIRCGDDGAHPTNALWLATCDAICAAQLHEGRPMKCTNTCSYDLDNLGKLDARFNQGPRGGFAWYTSSTGPELLTTVSCTTALKQTTTHEGKSFRLWSRGCCCETE
ncbi:MAG: hypothetical protein WBV82_20230, partial [Myxococcaceae bacterium]